MTREIENHCVSDFLHNFCWDICIWKFSLWFCIYPEICSFVVAAAVVVVILIKAVIYLNLASDLL